MEEISIHDSLESPRKFSGIQNQMRCTAITDTFDVSSLYTNISHGEGIKAYAIALVEIRHTSPSISDIVILMNHVITKQELHFYGQPFSAWLMVRRWAHVRHHLWLVSL